MSDKKVQLTKLDKSQIEHMQKSSPVQVYLRNKNKTLFTVGDILIKKHYDAYDEKVRTETVSRSSNAPKKYMCVFVDDMGIPYVKHMKVNGELSDGVFSVSDMGLDYSWYEADPEMAEHIILGEEGSFDPLEKFKRDKEQRAKIKEGNRKIREKTNNRVEILALLAKLNVGNSYWKSVERDSCLNVEEYQVVSKKMVTIVELKQSKYRMGWNFDVELEALRRDSPGTPDKFYVLEITDCNGNKDFVTEDEFWRSNIFLSKPTSVREK